MKGVSRAQGAHTRRSRVDGGVVADALERWTYSVQPSPTAALVRYLSGRFPDADVRRGARRAEADVEIDGVGVVLVSDLGAGFLQEFHLLRDQYDDLVCYSTSVHRDSPTDWVELAHRNRNRDVQFVSPPEPATGDGETTVGPAATVGLVTVIAVGIAGLLAGSLGLFSTAETGLAATELLFVGAAGAAALAVALAGYWLRSRPTVESALARLAQ